jgi:hypothetical protein
MGTVAQVLSKIRFGIKDMEQTSFSDYQLLEFYNAGNKILRKLILDQFPSMLTITDIGDTIVGSGNTLTNKALRITDVRINGAKVNKIDITQVADKTISGKPCGYYLTSLDGISWYPLPDSTYAYEVSYVPSVAELTDTDDTGYPSEIELLIVDYVISMANGTGQDTVTDWGQEISNILGNVDSETTIVSGYW